ncbi:MAG: T9SS type A sorting domain-containing protein [Bacteroidales bacterium]|nr:T9SS type A sorting domain-containing protein [Bacteroidales bacterium]
MRKSFLASFVFLMVVISGNAQYSITVNNGETVNGSSGTIELGSYVPGEVYSLTICSDNPISSHISISSTEFVQGNGILCVFDGNSSSAPLLGCFTETLPSGFSASANNLSGCLTIQFFSNSPGSTFSGSFTSSFQCQNLEAEISSSPSSVITGECNILEICQGEAISFFGSGIYQNTTYTQADITSVFEWDFGDGNTATGQNVNHTYSNAQSYEVVLTITDAQGCSSTISNCFNVFISGTPVFAGSMLSPIVNCQGDIINLTGIVNPVSYTNEENSSLSYSNSYPTQMWTVGATGGSMIAANQGTYDGTGLSTTSQPFIFTVVDDFGCYYDTTIFATILGSGATNCCIMPTTNITSSNSTVCSNSFELTATDFSIADNQGIWTYTGPGTAIFSNPTEPNTLVTVNLNGAYTFTWTEINNGNSACTASDNVTITFADELIVNAGSDGSICGNVYFLDAGTLEAGQTGTWTSVPPTTGANYANFLSPTTTVTIPAYSGSIEYLFTWTVDNGTCVISDDVEVTFYEEPAPNAGTNATVCGSIYDLNVTGVVGEGYWTVETTGGVPVTNVIFYDTSNPTNPYPEREPSVQANIALVGTSTSLVFIWNETNEICTETDNVEIVFLPGPYAYAGIDNYFCGDSIQLHADTIGVGLLNGYWTDSYGLSYWNNITGESINPANDPNAYVSIPDSLSYLFVDGIATLNIMWNIENGGCVSSDVVTHLLYQMVEPFAGIDANVGGLSYTMQAIQSEGATQGFWSQLSGPGTVIYSSSTVPTVPAFDPNVMVLVSEPGVYVFEWTETNNSVCINSETVSITFNAIPTDLHAGNDTISCRNSSGEYLAEIEVVGSYGLGLWHCDQSGISFENQYNNSTQISSSLAGLFTICWKELVDIGSSEPFEMESCFDIVFAETPQTIVLTEDDWVCGPQYFSIGGFVIDADTAYWFDASHAGTSFINDTVNVSIYGTHEIYRIAENLVQIGSYTASCSDTSEALHITFYEWPEPTVAATDTTCGSCYRLVGNQSMDSTFVTWSALSPSGITFSSTGTIFGTSAIDTVCVNIVDTTRYIDLTEYYPYQNRCAVSTQIAVKFARIPYAIYTYDAPNCFGDLWSVSAMEDTLPIYDWNFGSGGYIIDSYENNSAGGNFANNIYWENDEPFHIVDLRITNSYGCSSPIYRDTLFEPPVNYANILGIYEPCTGMSNGWVTIEGAGGLAPFAYHSINWLSAEGDITVYSDSIYVSNLSGGIYQVEIVDTFDCIVANDIEIIESSHLFLEGEIIVPTGIPTEGSIDIQLFSQHSGTTMLASTVNNNSGEFLMEANGTGDFVLLAKPSAALYPNLIPTFYYETALWDNVTNLNGACHDTIEANITMIELVNLASGTNYINGKVYYQNLSKDYSNPVAGVSMYVAETGLLSNIYRYKVTNDTGAYQFIGLPTGNFTILADIPGLPLISTHEISLYTTDSVLLGYDFIVDTTSSAKGFGIFATGGTIGVNEINSTISVVVYPNPVAEYIIIDLIGQTSKETKISVYDGMGKVLLNRNYKNTGEQNTSIVINEFASYTTGIYYIKIQMDNKIFLKKVVKN